MTFILILTIFVVFQINLTVSQIPVNHLCKKTTAKIWVPTTECGERCKMNPPEKNTVAFCTNEKCFCYKQYIIPGNVDYTKFNETKKKTNSVEKLMHSVLEGLPKRQIDLK
uniref:CSON002227 protein n=1 Tax=Culicoides sonorensis TaxID=179676 RepID=A0A336MJY6_CULSO